MARIGELLTTLLRRRTLDGDPLSDAVLLDRFTRTRDQVAFELLVWRHGPLVLASCRRMLRNDHTAEDAFQATFLVLARKAGSVRGAVAGWLHRVALRVCLRMKRRLPPVSLDTEPAASPDADPVESAERSAILDEEVARLPEFLRVPVIVCYLQGHTTEHAAAILGIPRGTVLSRLATARGRLAARLVRRGVGPAVAVLAAMSIPELSADAGRVVAETAIGFTLGKTPHTVPTQLALEVLAMTNRTAVVMAAGVLVLVAGLGTGIGFVAAQGQRPTPTTPTDTPAHKLDKPTPVPTPANEKDTIARKERLMKLLDQVETQIATKDGDDPELLRTRLRTQELRLAELQSQVRTGLIIVPPELTEQFELARERSEAARRASISADVLAAAVKLHPKMVEVQAKLTAKENELRTSKLPRDDAGWKKLDEERVGLWKQTQTVQQQVTPEVEAYLRVPGILDAQKALTSIDRKVRQIEMTADSSRRELLVTEEEVAQLKKQLAKLEPRVEEATWLKEKRRRLKQELLELELREVGIGK